MCNAHKRSLIRNLYSFSKPTQTRKNMANQLKTTLEDRLVREKERQFITQLSRTSAFILEKKGLFPKRRRLSPGGQGVAWLLSELLDFVNSREFVDSGSSK